MLPKCADGSLYAAESSYATSDYLADTLPFLGHSHFLARDNAVHGSTPSSILEGLSLGHSTAKQDRL